MQNEKNIEYTYKHRQVVIYLATKYLKDEKTIAKIKNHDIDKMFTYLFYDKKTASQIHRSTAHHHANKIEKQYEDYIEMVLDWESARYTKEDKPLNAYDTLYKYYPELEDKILPILKKLNLAQSNLPMEEDVKKYADNIICNKNIIKKELIMYLNKIFKWKD